ncbi:uncharacterized protein LOC133320155 [Danaus plexippus]|uniref:uncharacterized protein LOC133320155 n=1 Tax=Danaus plexippus TaxID=13037 RepID=UPI002AB2D6AD|nr:uncharacterized protein LOC133320155 [Danaus plexippus]
MKGHRFHREYGRVGRSYWRCTKRVMHGCKATIRIINGHIYPLDEKVKAKKRQEILEKKKIAERARYERIKSDPLKYAKLLEKYKKKYESRKRRGVVKLVKDMTEEELQEARRVWRAKAAAYRKKIT